MQVIFSELDDEWEIKAQNLFSSIMRVVNHSENKFSFFGQNLIVEYTQNCFFFTVSELELKN